MRNQTGLACLVKTICRMTESRAFFSGIVLLVNVDVEAVETRCVCVFVCVLDRLKSKH